ncbi:MAG: hypothetical protein JNM72_06230 [Deltaproteobacteria bacterium]|nr:hypothetical protein [Deltaproteobacteria bacterium]
MSIDRQRLEQEALQFIQKGQNEKALERYVTLLKAEPRDVRLRQQVADLYLKLGKIPEGDKHLRELAKQLRTGGKERMAIGVYKQIIKLKPDDAPLYGEMGDCYAAASLPQDAKASWTRAIELLGRSRPDQAIVYVEKLIRLEPGELALKVKVAELCEAANWGERASQEWRRLAQEARRLGRIEDRARFAENALKRRPDDVDALAEAADARNAMGEYDAALKHLQRGIGHAPQDRRLLSALGEALDGLGAREKSRAVWRELARVAWAVGDAAGRAEALGKAVAAGEADPGVLAELGEAQQVAERAALRLTDQEWAMPSGEAEGRAWVRARTLARYGFAERARVEVERLNARGLAMLVLLAELRAEVGDAKGAAQVLRGLSLPRADAQQQLHIRVGVLEGKLAEGLSAAPAAAPAAEDDELLDDEPTGGLLEDDGLVDDELVDDEPTGGGIAAPALAPLGTAAASGPAPSLDDDDAAWSFLDEPAAAPAVDDLDPSFFSDVLAPAPTAAPSPTPPRSAAPTATSAAAPSPMAGVSLPAAAIDALALLRVGAVEAAGRAARGDRGLHGERLLARALAAGGDPSGALRGLQDAVDESAEADAGYAEALIELAALNAQAAKFKRAQRLLDEATDLGGDPDDIALVRRAVALLGG